MANIISPTRRPPTCRALPRGNDDAQANGPVRNRISGRLTLRGAASPEKLRSNDMTEHSLDMTLSESPGTSIVTRGSAELRLRSVTADDADLLSRFYDALAPDDMRFRFLSAQPHLSSAQLAAMIGVDHRHREHLLAFDSETGDLVASLLIAADDKFETAEVAIALAPAYKRRGVGWSLLSHAVDLARKRGLKRLRSIESRANHEAIDVERTLGFKSSPYEGDATLALLEIDLRDTAE